LGGMFLEGVNPTQERINKLYQFDNGEINPVDYLKNKLARYK
jgi:hypothetical protein